MPFEDGYVLKRIIASVMSFMSKWKVFSQICVLIAFMVLVFMVQGLMGYFNLKAMKAVTANDFNGSVNNLITISGVNEEILKIRSEYLLALSNVRAGMSLDLSSLLMRVQALQMLNPDPATIGTIEQTVGEIETLLKQPVSRINYERLDSKLIATSMLLQSLQRKVKDSAINSMESGNSYTRRSLVVNIIILIFSVLLSFVLGLTIATSISQPLKSIVTTTNSLAVGDLSQNLEAQGTLEIVDVVRGLNHAIGGLRELVRGINEQSEMVLYAGKELTAASVDSGKSATEVARAMEELARASSDQA
ncbi:MAG TPA: methyl-accepting chemotaxis protein, partial [Bacillota bacterium]|nr:methyl-accepting chemotaxis protein [Bacillota bacterium]